MQNPDKLIFVGIISSCSGIKGDVIVRSYTQIPEEIFNLSLFTENNIGVNLKLIRKNANGNLICKLNEIHNRNDAEKWTKQKLFCLRSDLPKAADDEFYIEDLRGLTVINETGDEIGAILALHNFGAGDIVEIEFLNKKTIMLPFNNNFFPRITEKYVVSIITDDDY